MQFARRNFALRNSACLLPRLRRSVFDARRRDERRANRTITTETYRRVYSPVIDGIAGAREWPVESTLRFTTWNRAARLEAYIVKSRETNIRADDIAELMN